MEGDPSMPSPAREQFAIRLSSVGELFWEFDARPVAERSISGDARWAILDEWDRVRKHDPSALLIYAPEADREFTDEDAVRKAIHSSLESASGPLRRVDPLSRQEKVALLVGVAFWFLSIALSTGLDKASDGLLSDALSQGLVLVGWVALWRPAERFIVEVVPHVFNKRRFAEFTDIPVRFVWY
jgi:hypothetical protein